MHSTLWTCLVVVATCTPDALASDFRRFGDGHRIPDQGYCDQPYLVVTKDGNWLCTMTTGAGQEGDRGQHVVATISADQGRTWSELIDIEPAEGTEASWVVPLITPSGRVYVFYTYNGDGVGHGKRQFALPDKGATYRADIVGWYCYRYSDDHGRSWSKERYRLPLSLAPCDRANQWQGKVQIFWGIDKPDTADGVAFFAFTRLGRFFLENGEGWLFRSPNVLSEPNVDRLTWELLPQSDRGIRHPTFGSVQEEHNIVPLGDNRLYCVYRTTKGHPCHTYSNDGGRTWETPVPMTYTPGGRIMRNPRACPMLWRTNDGHYLFWFHNNGNTSYGATGPYSSRNLVWLSGGKVVDGRMHWSQPELVRYCTHSRQGCSYPDLLEDQGRYYLSATQKTEARINQLDRDLLRDLWQQDSLNQVATKGLVLDHSATATAGAKLEKPTMPSLKSLAEGSGFSIEMWVPADRLAPGSVLMDSRGDNGAGILVAATTDATFKMELCDASCSTQWESDQLESKARGLHHVVFIVDGGPKLIACVIDGQLCDGGASGRPYGYARFRQTRYPERFSDRMVVAPELGDVTGGPSLDLSPTVARLRMYDRALRISEAVGNFRAGP
jgi:hypothetical protein